MRSGAQAKGPKGACDRLYSLIVRSRLQCERCGLRSDEVGDFQCAHIVSRRYSGTRSLTDPHLNAWCLCPKCHFQTGEDGVEFAKLVSMTIGIEAYEEIWQLARDSSGGKFDWSEERKRLKRLLTRIEDGELTTNDLGQRISGWQVEH